MAISAGHLAFHLGLMAFTLRVQPPRVVFVDGEVSSIGCCL